MKDVVLTKESDWKKIAQEWESLSAMELLTWAVNTYDSKITFACSFGAEDVAIVDMLMKINPKVDIFYLNTDLHFKETYETRDQLQSKYGVTFTEVRPALTLSEQSVQWGERLWERNPNQCCHIRKVEPLTNYLANVDAWITGIRREQSITRMYAKKIEWDDKFQCVKINPIADWTTEQVWQYIKTENLPYNSLHDKNYPSIGCEPCTRPVMPGEDARAGRWAGFEKTECGLHRDKGDKK